MTTFIREDSEEARKKMIKVPKELVSKAQAITTLIDASDGNKRKKDGKTKSINLRPLIENIEIKENSIIALILHKNYSVKPIEILNLFKEYIPDLNLEIIIRNQNKKVMLSEHACPALCA